MRKKIAYILLLLAALTVSSCRLPGFIQKTPKGYVRYCVALLDAQALYADTPEWKVKKREVLSALKSVSTMDDAHSAVQDAAGVAGGKHSFLQAPVKDTASYEESAPEVKMLEEGIVHIVLPAHSGVKVSDSLYIHRVLDPLQECTDATGVIIDLRGNTGGNMYPMITSVSPLLPDGVIIKFKSRKRVMPITLEYVTSSYRIPEDKMSKFPASTPTAILTDDHTASSGEATLLCFRGLDNTRTFGAPTAGYASANVTHLLADGYQFAITRSCDMARTGEVFCDDPIEPDVMTDTPLEDAIAWIESLNQ